MANAPTWKPVLNSLIEMFQGMYTHITESSLVGTRIDRTYCFGPSWIMSLVKGNCHIWRDARVMHLSGISDHAPVSSTLAAMAQIKTNNQRIPSFIFKHPVFKQRHDELATEKAFEFLEPEARLLLHKAIIKDAAKVCRSFIHDIGFSHTNNTYGRNLCLSAISKCLIANDAVLARQTLSRDVYARKFIDIQHGKVIITHPEEFADEFSKVRSEYLDLEQKNLDQDGEDISTAAPSPSGPSSPNSSAPASPPPETRDPDVPPKTRTVSNVHTDLHAFLSLPIGDYALLAFVCMITSYPRTRKLKTI